MSTYFAGMLLVYLFVGILSFFWYIICKKMHAIISNRNCYVVSLLRHGKNFHGLIMPLESVKLVKLVNRYSI